MPVTKWFAAKDVLLFEVSLNTSQSSIAAVVFDRRATKHPAKFRAALRVGAAPAPRRVAGSLNRSSTIRLASEGGEAKAGAFAYAPCESSGGAPNVAIPASDLVH
jgi:hypothetical protein